MSESLNKYQLIWWRPIYDIGFCYLIIGLCIYFSYLCPASYVFLIFIIANRQLALSLICHEALHENLFKNKKLNNFVGRWLCAFPTWISFSKYKKLHLLHHSGLGLSHDPDRHLYQQYPVTWKNYLQDQAKSLIQFKTMVRFLKYYTELLDLKSYYSKKDIKTFFKRLMAGDFIYFLIFKCTLLFVLIKRDLYIEYLLFFMCPILFIVQPYVWFMAGLQHGPQAQDQKKHLLSRTINLSKYVSEIVLPLDIHFHAEHHFNPSIPHYWLRKYSEDLKKNNKLLWVQTYADSFKTLFNTKI